MDGPHFVNPLTTAAFVGLVLPVANVNRAAVNVCVLIFESVFMSPGYRHPGLQLLGNMVTLNSLRSRLWVQQWLHRLTFPPATHTGSNFSTSLAALSFCCIIIVAELLYGCGIILLEPP